MARVPRLIRAGAENMSQVTFLLTPPQRNGKFFNANASCYPSTFLMFLCAGYCNKTECNILAVPRSENSDVLPSASNTGFDKNSSEGVFLGEDLP